MPETQRIAMGIEYNGSAYNGWQIQSHSPSVQYEVEKALSTVAAESIRIFCAGRTDTGVHGLGQVIHFDTQADRTERAWVFGTNANLPKDVTAVWAKSVPDEFHARFSAVSRRYRYVILNRDVRPAVLGTRVSWEYRPLDVSRMQEAARHLLGEHDFSSYRALACQAKSPVRTVMNLEVTRKGELIYIDIEANAFLHHMVRNIAGVLMTIGAGEKNTDWSKTVLEHRDRTMGGVTASPYGLYLTGVAYPDEFAIPQPVDLSQIV
jgi:tRNA pseudouridine38-40 synthase